MIHWRRADPAGACLFRKNRVIGKRALNHFEQNRLGAKINIELGIALGLVGLHLRGPQPLRQIPAAARAAWLATANSRLKSCDGVVISLSLSYPMRYQELSTGCFHHRHAKLTNTSRNTAPSLCSLSRAPTISVTDPSCARARSRASASRAGLAWSSSR